MLGASKKKSILIFDENNHAQELYASLLSLDKVSSYFCPRGVDPVAHARRLAVDGMIVSVDPSLDERLTFIHRLTHNKETKKNPLLVITAQGDPYATRLIRQHYPGILLVKPFSIHQFRKIIKDIFFTWWSRGESNP